MKFKRLYIPLLFAPYLFVLFGKESENKIKDRLN